MKWPPRLEWTPAALRNPRQSMSRKAGHCYCGQPLHIRPDPDAFGDREVACYDPDCPIGARVRVTIGHDEAIHIQHGQAPVERVSAIAKALRGHGPMPEYALPFEMKMAAELNERLLDTAPRLVVI